MSQQSNDTPMNPQVSITNLPQPQVVSGTLGEQGQPLAAVIPASLVNILDQNLMNNVDFIGHFTHTTSQQPGVQIGSLALPIMASTFGGAAESQGGYIPTSINWSHSLFRSHEYWDPVCQFSFVFVGPQPMIGKILITYDPTSFTDTNNGVYREDMRKIVQEWDLALSKEATIEITGFKLEGKRPIQSYETPAWQFNQWNVGPETRIHRGAGRLGRISLNVKQRLQKFSIFPDSYTILVFMSYKNTLLYTPTDPRVRDQTFIVADHLYATATQNLVVP